MSQDLYNKIELEYWGLTMSHTYWLLGASKASYLEKNRTLKEDKDVIELMNYSTLNKQKVENREELSAFYCFAPQVRGEIR